MQKKFFTDLLLLVALNLLIKPIAIFGIDAAVQNEVGTSSYGLYFTLLNLSFLFNIVMDLGINNYTTKHLAEHPHIVSRYIGKIFSFRLILFAFYAIVTLAIGVGIGYRDEALLMLLVLIFNQLLATLIAYFRSHFGGLHLFRTDAVISVLDKLILILICGTILYADLFGGKFKIEWFIWIQTICYGLTLITAFILLTRRIGVPKFRFSWVFSLAIIRKSFPYALFILLMMIYTRTDSIMLERLHPKGAYESGIYAQGFRLLDAFFMFGMIFANMLLPIFARMLKHDRAEVEGMVSTSRNLLVGGSILIAFVCSTNAEWIMQLIYHEDTLEAAGAFYWLIWSFVGICISFIYGTLLTAKGDLRFLNQLSVIGILLNIALNALVIPTYGAAGSAFATLITQSFTALIQMIYCHAKIPLQFSLKTGASFVGLIALMVGSSFLKMNDGFTMLIQLLVGTLGLFLFRLIDLRAIVRVFREKQ